MLGLFSRIWLIVKFIANDPKYAFSILNLQTIRNAFSSIFFGAYHDVDNIINNHNLARDSGSISKDVYDHSPGRYDGYYYSPHTNSKDLDTLRHIALSPSPAVSIVIPCYNNWELSKQCIASILCDSSTSAFEIIVADDFSIDETRFCDKSYPFLIRNCGTENHGFTRNCNNAAIKARGEFLIFLNNDTLVHDGWRDAIVAPLKASSDIGLVGSKLLFPDGKLQEAGGVVFSDGSGWNYGRGDDPTLPQYNYVRETDYVSGASIALRTATWKSLGGFDERYCPAYYEDTDLAFRVRESGLKVLYEPNSVVTHIEGASHGTDESGIKRHQEINRHIFIERWQNELEKQAKGPEDLFNARERAYDRLTILVIDHYVPWFDKDAGSRSTYLYLKAFIQLGFRVKFLGDNFFPHQPYTKALNDMGIEVLYGPKYANGWASWLAEHHESIDVAYVHRPHIAPKYLDALSAHGIRVVYQCHDLHFLRAEREAAVTGSASSKINADRYKRIELEILERVDCFVTFSEFEKRVLGDMGLDDKVAVIPIFPFGMHNVDSSPKQQKLANHILFIGSFTHQPNVDGLEWFLEECWGIVNKQVDDCELQVIGDNLPRRLVDKLPMGVNYHGYVADQTLDQLYRSSKLAIAPLRYGAGIKGKVIDAVLRETPVVVTKVAAEGIFETGWTDDAHEFALECVSLLSDSQSRTEKLNSQLSALENSNVFHDRESIIDIFGNGHAANKTVPHN